MPFRTLFGSRGNGGNRLGALLARSMLGAASASAAVSVSAARNSNDNSTVSSIVMRGRVNGAGFAPAEWPQPWLRASVPSSLLIRALAEPRKAGTGSNSSISTTTSTNTHTGTADQSNPLSSLPLQTRTRVKLGSTRGSVYDNDGNPLHPE